MRPSLLLIPIVALAVAACSGDRPVAGPMETPFTPAFDDIPNSLDASVDAEAEVMSLVAGGANGTTILTVVPINGDGKNGCNLTGSTTLVVAVVSSNAAVATVSPSPVTFGSCGDVHTLTVTPVAVGSATISLSLISNTTDGTFNLAPATFIVNVTAPAPTNTPPAVSVTGVTHGASYEIGSVTTAACSVIDAEDGNTSFPATLSVITGPFSSFGVGSQTADCSHTDSGGLSGTASATYDIVDTGAPLITFVSRTPAPNGFGWNNGDVTVVWSCTDGGSGVVSPTVTEVVSGEGASQSASGTCTDNVGLAASDTQTGINIDKTAPSVDCSVPDQAIWYATNQTVNCTAEDGLSDLANSTDENFSLSTNVAPGSETNAASTGSKDVADKADNSTAAGPYTFMIDIRGPAVTLTCPTSPVLLGSTASASWTATDNGSGVADGYASGSVALDAGTVGSKTATAPAGSSKDNVDNESSAATCDYSVIYDWNGFFQPVENLNWNSARAGQSIPVKFSLGGNQGLNIFATGYPKVVAIACPSSSTPVDAIDEYTTTANHGLVYDAVADQYNYVWKTDKGWAGKCFRLEVKLNDGTPAHTAIFKFTK